MKTATCTLKSASPYSQSKKLPDEEKKHKELPGAYEDRVWRERMHVTPEGNVFIPPMAFSNCIKEAAKYMSIPVPGKRMATFTKFFESSVLCADALILDIKAKDVECERLFVPSDGKRGSGKRVWRNFPLIHEWSGVVKYYIVDDIITLDVFEQVLKGAGQFIGIGRFRPRNCGYYGRFLVENIEWNES